ncbi:MAG: 4-hydroxy-tetrahydrodipicolinate reductase [Oscillospiraceae bacterium]|nr:4-hydroxy-tetrahydrodipicolinate reductase [Oscillospiraceae bacterium]
MIKILISGIMGKMGQTLVALIDARVDCTVFAGVDTRATSLNGVPVYRTFDDILEKPDVIIDFSTPAATSAAIAYCEKNLVPIVICTTGLDDSIQDKMHKLALKVPVFSSANMSLGVNLLIELCKAANNILGDSFDIEIVEKHHNRKLDAPSGTALMIADEINQAANGKYEYVYDRHAVRQKRDKKELGIHAVRGGTIVGEHEVLFCGPDEVITLSHSAASRDVFANGAINAAIFISRKTPKFYSMKDLIAL